MQLHSSSRPVANLSFALNYYAHQYDTTGYHIINLLLHMITAFLLFLIARHTMERINGNDLIIPSLAAVLWLVNPVHTQSVTYIVQRMNAMAAMFYMLALFLYIRGRSIQTAANGKTRLPFLLFAASLLAGLCALGAKQIAATLPIFIFLYEWYFFRDLDARWLKQQLKWIIALVLVFGGVALTYLGTNPFEKIFAMYDTQDFTMGQRLLSEPRVVLYYLTLLFFPYPGRLNLDYDYPVSLSLISPLSSAWTLLAVIGLLALAILIAKKQRLLSFAILWFFGILAVESTFIGLAPIFDHRTYLPSIFLFIAITYMAFNLVKYRRAAVAMLVLAILISGFWSWQRNMIWKDKLAFWQDCVNKSPNRTRPQNNLGNVYLSMGEWDKAIVHLKKAIKIDPTYVEAFNNLGQALFQKGQTEAAIANLKKAVAINPQFAFAYHNLGKIYHATGETQKALDYCNHTIALSPFMDKTYNNLGIIRREAGELDKALQALDKAIAINPTYANAYLNRGLVRMQKGDTEKAIEDFKKTLQLNPQREKAYNNLGILYQKKGKIDTAITCYRNAIEANPDFEKAYQNLGMALYLKGNVKDAVSCFEKALRINPDYQMAEKSLVLVEGKRKKYGPAIDEAEKEFKAQPNNHLLAYKLGRLYEAAGMTRKARHQYETLLKNHPDFAHGINALARLYAATGKTAQAIDLFERLARVRPENPTVFYNLACLHARQQKTDSAISYLKQAVDKGYHDIETLKLDKDLQPVRETKEYQEILARCRDAQSQEPDN
ncbi:MAG: tetratricopeptide repeat protein [Thermodesulfobacteriota bacterium]|nr:tetratricopeptide repeat protein [Thermodesulfobacteriota bacterium]